MNVPTGPTGPSILHTPAYISAYSANDFTVPALDNVPLTTVMASSKNITLDKKNNALIPTVAGVYSVFITIRASAGIASVVLMQDETMFADTTINIDSENMIQSLMAFINVEANKPINLRVMTGPLILPTGTNASITMNLIQNTT